MHRGVQEFLSWIRKNPGFPGLAMRGPATAIELGAMEERIVSPLPADLRLVLARHNGGALPTGRLLSAGRRGEGSMLDALEELAGHVGRSVDDPELMLPFYRMDDGGILAFDRSAGPVSDTWPVVDFYPDSGALRLVYRPFDGFCRLCVAEWNDPQFESEFTLERYLESGERHVRIEPDVSVAHATVAHALRRAGKPEDALSAYLEAARCVPSQPWCDWEALKIAVLIGDVRSALEAAQRLCSRAPAQRWVERETSPRMVADVLGHLASVAEPREGLLRLFDQLSEQTQEAEEKQHIAQIRRAVHSDGELPSTVPLRPLAVQGGAGLDGLWREVCAGYEGGTVRDDDLLLEPAYRPLKSEHDLGDVLRIVRRF